MIKNIAVRFAACAVVVVGAILPLCAEEVAAEDARAAAQGWAAKVVHVGSGCEFACTNENAGAAFDLPSDFKADANADVFMIKR